MLRLVGRFRFLTGKHIKELVSFPSNRTKERRLKLLVDNHYLDRQKILYGFPYFYTLSHKGRIILGLNKRADKIRIERIKHDLLVLDVVVYILNKYNITLNEITTEKELHKNDGFGNRKHQPDFIFSYNNEIYAVEVELTVKAKDILLKNVKLNYLSYDYQFWFIEKSNKKLKSNLDKCTIKYNNSKIYYLEEL